MVTFADDEFFCPPSARRCTSIFQPERWSAACFMTGLTHWRAISIFFFWSCVVLSAGTWKERQSDRAQCGCDRPELWGQGSVKVCNDTVTELHADTCYTSRWKFPGAICCCHRGTHEIKIWKVKEARKWRRWWWWWWYWCVGGMASDKKAEE